MSLPGLDAAPALFQPEVIPSRRGRLLGYNLFLAIVPQPDEAQGLAVLGAELRDRHGLQGQCLQARHLHVSLQGIAAYGLAIPREDIDAARVAAASVVCPPVPITFDRAGSFRNDRNPSNNAFVLRCDARSDAAVSRLRQTLAMALRRSGFRPKSSSTPHMTLLYDHRLIPEHPITPICWTATHFALILSHQGLRHHEWLGEWQLA